jgi:hypothetical protein
VPTASSAVDSAHPDATQPPTAPTVTEPSVSASEPTATTLAPDAQPPSPSTADRGDDRQSRRPDEATMRKSIREIATRDIRDGYTLLLEDLELPPAQNEELVALLIEMQIESTSWTPSGASQMRGRDIGQQERYDRIATVIGEQKLIQLLELEENRQAYWETQQIATLLRRRGVPLVESQRDRMFEILVEVRDRYPPMPQPSGDVDPVEAIDQVLRQLDEFDRHVMELAPSALSQGQVLHLFDAYQRMSRERIDHVERQKKRHAADPDQPFVGGTPGRWSPYITR